MKLTQIIGAGIAAIAMPAASYASSPAVAQGWKFRENAATLRFTDSHKWNNASLSYLVDFDAQRNSRFDYQEALGIFEYSRFLDRRWNLSLRHTIDTAGKDNLTLGFYHRTPLEDGVLKLGYFPQQSTIDGALGRFVAAKKLGRVDWISLLNYNFGPDKYYSETEFSFPTGKNTSLSLQLRIKGKAHAPTTVKPVIAVQYRF